MKKIISWILVFAICLSMLPASVFAEAAEEGTEEQVLAVAEKEPEPEDEEAAEPEAESETDPEVARVQALLDALPEGAELTEEDLEALYEAYDAYLALTEAQQAQIAGAERFEELFTYVNSQVSVMADNSRVETTEGDKKLIQLTNYTGTEQIKLEGATILELTGNSSITCNNPIFLDHNTLIIRGTGTLTLTNTADRGAAIGNNGSMYGTVTLESGTLICQQTQESECTGHGIFAENVNVAGGRLEAYGADGGCGIWSQKLNVTSENAAVYATGLYDSDAIRTDSFQMNSKLAVLYADTPKAQEKDMRVGTEADVENHQTVCIQKSDKPMLSVGEQQGNLYVKTRGTATFAITARNVQIPKVEWEEEPKYMTAAMSADGKTLTVTATYASEGTYTLKLTALSTDGITTVTKSIPITVSKFQMAITKNPQDILANKSDSAYQNAKLTMEVQASEPMEYQWYYIGSGGSYDMAGQTKNELYVKDIPDAAFTQSVDEKWKSTAQVYCTATYGSYNRTSSAWATVTVVDCPDHQGHYDNTGKCTRCGEQAGADCNWVCDGIAYQGNRIGNMVGEGNTTIYLLRDIDALESGTVPANVTVDLNGHTVGGLAVENFQNTIIQNGTIQSLYLPDNGKNTGAVTLNNLTVSSGAKISDGAEVTVGEGCVFKTKLVLDKMIRLTAGTFEKGIQLNDNLNWEDLLPVGYGCYKKDGSLIRFAMGPYANYLKVGLHTCTWDEFGTCTDCGRACRHPNMGASSKCPDCGLVEKPFAIGSQAYATPEEALAAAQDGDTVTMRGNYRIRANVPLEVNKQVTLDTGSYTLISDYMTQNGATLEVSGDLTLKGNVKNDYSTKSVPAILVKDGGKLTVQSGTVTGGSSASQAGTPIGISGHTDSEILVEGGNINALSTNGKLTVTGGQVGKLHVPLYDVDIHLSGGSFGSICSTDTTHTLTAAERGALLETYYAYFADGAPVKLGELTNDTNVTVRPCTHPEGISADDTCPYCGKTCQHENLDANGKCTTCQAQVSEAKGGSGTIYRTLKEALDAGEQSVTLLKYAELNPEDLPSVELNLDEYLLYIKGVLMVSNNTSLTLKGPGMLMAGGIVIPSGSTLTISGEVDAYSSPGVSNSGTFYMNGGQINKLYCKDGSTTVLSAGKITTVEAPTGKVVADLLAPGKAFYHSGNVVNGNQTKLNNGPYEIKDHTHSIGEDGSCSCGYQAEASLTVDGQTEYMEKLTEALEKAQKSEKKATVKLLKDIAYSVTVSQQLTLDFNGHTLEKLVASGVSLEELLPEGYAFKSNSQWINDTAGLTELNNVTSALAPIASITAKNPTVTVTYGQSATLEVEVKCNSTGGEYGWYLVTDKGLTGVSGSYSSYSTPKDAAVGTHTYRYIFTVNGYSKSCDFTVKVNRVTNKIRNKDYKTEYTYGDSIPAPKRENFTVEGWDEGQLEFVWRDAGSNVVKTPKNAGTYTLYVKLAEDANHNLVQASFTVTVAKKALTVTAKDSKITYGDVPTGTVQYDGFVEGEDQGVLGGELAYESNYRQYGDVGTYTITPTGLISQNYEITYQPASLTVSPREIEVAWSNTAFTYDGSAQVPTAAVKNAVNSDKLTLEVSGAQTNAGENYRAEVTKITGDKAGNYRIAENAATDFTIHKAQWKYTAPTAKTLTYNGQKQALAEPGTVENGGRFIFRFGEIFAADIPTGTNVGEYDIYWKLPSDRNHLEASGNFQVTIAPKNIADNDVTVTLGEKLTYNGKAQTQSIASVKFGSLDVTYEVANNTGKDAGKYIMRLNGTGNYTGTREVNFSIAQKALTVTAQNHTITYGSAPANNGVRYDGFVNGETESVLGGKLTYAYTYTQYGNTGDYKITPSGLESKNYTITYGSGTLTVGRKPVILTAKVAEKSFDNTRDAEVTLTLNGIVAPDVNSVKVDTGKATFAQRIPGTWEVSYDRPCQLTGDKAINYDLQPTKPKMRGTIRANARFLDVTEITELNGESTLTIEEQRLPIDEATADGKMTRYVDLGDTTGLATTYTYEKGTPAQTTDNYPTGMKVYRVNRADKGSTLKPISAFDDLLQYEGSSIRISGKPGIRMITGVDRQTKQKLISGNLEGFSLVEYGTVIQWQGVLKDANLTQDNGKYNYAYKYKKADPVFGKNGNSILYTNVLVWDSLTDEQYNAGIVMRPYIVLKDTQTGTTHTLYGGCVTRSIVNIARQNETTYNPGTKGYKYIQSILARAKEE